ncbi:hypothetical protein HYX06_02075 [Candidatus Woesearchaeota archaeon]|nr:hypothetical protein [Candidatus Woesearchaeota archaeon]
MRKIIATLAAASMLLSYEASAVANLQQTPKQAEHVQAQSLEDRLRSIKDHDNIPLVNDGDIQEFRKKGISIAELLAIASVQKNNKSVFCREYFRDYILGGGTSAYISSITKSTGEVPSDGTILELWVDKDKCKGSNLPAVAEELGKIKDGRGRPFFNVNSRYLAIQYCGIQFDISQVRGVARGVLDPNGNPFFGGETLLEFVNAGGSAQYANRFREKFTLTPRELADLKAADADPKKFGRFVAETGLDASTAAYYFVLGVDSMDKFSFKDTNKPNALIAYAHYDPDGALRNDTERKILDRIREAYDLKVIIISSKKDIYNTVRSIPDIMLLGVNGHGGSNSLDLNGGSIGNREFIMADKEMIPIFEGLHPNASIYFASCLVERFARNMAALAGGRKVFAAGGSLRSTGVSIESLVPFEIKFYSSGKDITVTSP